MINTIQNYFDVHIDYYAKINFKGLVKLVDAVGGVDINVEQISDLNELLELSMNNFKKKSFMLLYFMRR